MVDVRKPFIYLAILAFVLGFVGVFLLSQDLSGKTILSHEKTYTSEEINAHNNLGDCWITMNEGVYDATIVIASYPEFSYLKDLCGDEAPYSLELENLLVNYRIGIIES